MTAEEIDSLFTPYRNDNNKIVRGAAAAMHNLSEVRRLKAINSTNTNVSTDISSNDYSSIIALAAYYGANIAAGMVGKFIGRMLASKVK